MDAGAIIRASGLNLIMKLPVNLGAQLQQKA